MTILRKFPDSAKELSNVRVLACCAMMLALRVVLGIFGNFSLSLIPFAKISLNFIPIMATAYYFGPVCAAIVAGAGDILAIIIANPTGFSLTPGITACCVLEGILYGMVLYRSQYTFIDLFLAQGLVLFICSLPLYTLVLMWLYGMSFWQVLLWRVIILVPYSFIEVGIMLALKKPILDVQKNILQHK